jgi:DNA-binding Lrp family transcriptional regulator
MKSNIKKFVYELSQDARIKTKELGKKLKISQQSASYLLQSFQKKKKILGYNTIIDPAKFGYLQVLVYLNFSDFGRVKEVVNFLKEDDNVVLIEDLRQGYDLAVVYCVPNLSLYNKKMRDFLQKFKRVVSLAEVYPIIVKHLYPRKYLAKQRKEIAMVISGDRDVVKMGEKEKVVLGLLHSNALESVIGMYKKSRLNPKTITRVKRVLEESNVIRGYTANFNLGLLGVRRKHLLISSRDLGLQDDMRLLQFCLQHPNVVSLVRVIGYYDMMIEIEEESGKRDFLKEVRSSFSIPEYKVIEGGRIVKNTYLPRNAIES